LGFSVTDEISSARALKMYIGKFRQGLGSFSGIVKFFSSFKGEV
jgi:hypothetical protein